jgi:hypothetical protein
VEDEKFNHFMEVIWRMYIHIPMLDAMQVPTYAKVFEGCPQPKATNTQNGQARVCREM